MFRESNHYTLKAETVDGATRYFVSFIDGEANECETEVSYEVYHEFLRFTVAERSLRHWDERHREYSEVWEETLSQRAVHQPKGLEDAIIDELQNERLRMAIRQLPKKQRRRFVLYHEHELTYEQIAEMEGCHFTSVHESVKCAEKKIAKIIKNF
jgi:RNA polymerase sigma-70 factor (ECF subfamily)